MNTYTSNFLKEKYSKTTRMENYELETDFCTEINLPIEDMLPSIYQELHKGVFYESDFNMLRSDTSLKLRRTLQDLIDIPIWCCGFFKNPPQWIYNLHTDSVRKSAINILLTDENKDFDSSFLIPPKNFITIPYRKNIPMLMNVKKFHYVKNNSKDVTRYIMSIGFHRHSYHESKEILYSKFSFKGQEP